MFQQLFFSESACRRHGDAPFADERERYLQHCAEQGSTRATLRVKARASVARSTFGIQCV